MADQDLDRLLHPEAYEEPEEIVITEEELKGKKKKPGKKDKKNPDENSGLKAFFSNKRNVVIVVLAALVLIAVGVLVALLILKSKPAEHSDNAADDPIQAEANVVKYYDNLTGELFSYSGVQYNPDGTEKLDENGSRVTYTMRQAQEQASKNNTKRINCVQIPNGTDARPQVGLSEAKIVYEAIAEGGITRFAAIFRGATSNVIGPVRSLRTYYLEWDTPYDCTIVHAGGEKKALNNVKSYVHLSESAEYMWRDRSAYYNPNNLFTSAELLDKFNYDKGKTQSAPKVFPRLTPDESDEELKKIRADETASEKKYAHAASIYVHHTSGSNNYNVNYIYNPSTNSYLRASDGNAGKHVAYTCKGLKNSGSKIKPQKDCGVATQLSPKVVIVMKVDEKLNQENHYREDIETTGAGEAWIFQNGIVLTGTWTRSTINAQIEFKDKNGNEIKLAPGQTWIHAVAKSYGYVKY